ncbi:MAG TPA: hypothetical protein VG147_04145 [Solirubrobacteraceae bacterium]|jgi:hypothetical protein|nr:hypothetical protein [Solirubrobacteraceae bacterium]
MNKLTQTAGLVVVGLVTITVASPALTKVIHALVPLVVVLGIVVALLRAVFWYTR